MRDAVIRNGRAAAALVIALFYAVTLGAPVVAASDSEKQAKRRAYVQNELTKLQAHRDVPLMVKLRNGRFVVGHLERVNHHSFIVTDRANRTSTQIAYSEVQQLSALSTRAKLNITAGIVAAAVLLYYVYMAAHSQ